MEFQWFFLFVKEVIGITWGVNVGSAYRIERNYIYYPHCCICSVMRTQYNSTFHTLGEGGMYPSSFDFIDAVGYVPKEHRSFLYGRRSSPSTRKSPLGPGSAARGICPAWMHIWIMKGVYLAVENNIRPYSDIFLSEPPSDGDGWKPFIL